MSKKNRLNLRATPLVADGEQATPLPHSQRAVGRIFTSVVALALIAAAANLRAQDLLVDFNSTNQDGAANPQGAYQSYDAAHEVAASFVTKQYNAFGTVVGVTPAWPNTTENRVQQMIDRTAGFDANWIDDGGDLALVTDFLGIDTRTANGGNGNWDGVAGTPTYMTLRLTNLPADRYDWVSFHHDTEHVHTFFQIEISTDGGNSFSDLGQDFYMSDTTAGGNPDSDVDGSRGVQTGPNAIDLTSNVRIQFSANGTDDVVLRFAPLSGTLGNAVHNQLWGINGFELRPLTVLFIGGQAGPTQGADGAVLAFLQDRYGAGNVTYRQASATAAGDESAFSALVISSTPGSGAMRNKFHNSTTPTLNWEEAIADSGAGEYGMSSVAMTKSINMTMMDLADHPITAGLPATIEFVTGGGETTNTTELFAGLAALATAADGTGSAGPGNGLDITGNPTVFIAEVGDAVNPGAGVTGNIAPARRVMFPMTDNTFNSLTDDGRTLFGQSIDWILGVPTGGGGNDAFASRTALSGASPSVQTDNSGATREAGEPSPAGVSATQWWSWTPPQTGWYEINTFGSDIDTWLGIYTGSAIGSLTPGAFCDDAFPGYDLRLMSVSAPIDLVRTGDSLVVVALVGADLWIRVFDANGQTSVNASERWGSLISGQELFFLKELLSEDPFPDESEFSHELRREIIKMAATVSGHRAFLGDFASDHEQPSRSAVVFQAVAGTQYQITVGSDPDTAGGGMGGGVRGGIALNVFPVPPPRAPATRLSEFFIDGIPGGFNIAQQPGGAVVYDVFTQPEIDEPYFKVIATRFRDVDPNGDSYFEDGYLEEDSIYSYEEAAILSQIIPDLLYDDFFGDYEFTAWSGPYCSEAVGARYPHDHAIGAASRLINCDAAFIAKFEGVPDFGDAPGDDGTGWSGAYALPRPGDESYDSIHDSMDRGAIAVMIESTIPGIGGWRVSDGPEIDAPGTVRRSGEQLVIAEGGCEISFQQVTGYEVIVPIEIPGTEPYPNVAADGRIPKYDPANHDGAGTIPAAYELRLMSVAGKNQLPSVGSFLVLVARVGPDVCIRIFDATGERVIDIENAQEFLDSREQQLPVLITQLQADLEQAEEDFDQTTVTELGEQIRQLQSELSRLPGRRATLAELEQLLGTIPFPNDANLSPEEKEEIIGQATSIAMITLPPFFGGAQVRAGEITFFRATYVLKAQLSVTAISNEDVTIEIIGDPGSNWDLEMSTDLDHWTELDDSIDLDSEGVGEVVVPFAAASSPRFYVRGRLGFLRPAAP